jgi:hypothetical protein
MQGHDATSYNPGMGAYYDNEAPEEILNVQRRTFPYGPLGAVLPIKVELESDRDEEALAIFDKYMAGKLGTMEFATLMEGAKIRVLSKPTEGFILA